MKSQSYQWVSDVDRGWRGLVRAGFQVAAGTFSGTFDKSLPWALNLDAHAPKGP